jgi:hypothetical protein
LNLVFSPPKMCLIYSVFLALNLFFHRESQLSLFTVDNQLKSPQNTVKPQDFETGRVSMECVCVCVFQSKGREAETVVKVMRKEQMGIKVNFADFTLYVFRLLMTYPADILHCKD